MNKTAVIYRAGGAIGGAVARAFAREGATLFLTGRNQTKVDAVAKDIRASGGKADALQVDARDEQVIDQHLDVVTAKTGKVDSSFNAVGIPSTLLQGVPLTELSVERSSLLTRNLSAELALHGIRVAGQRTDGMPETGTIREVLRIHAKKLGITWEQFHDIIAGKYHRRRLPTLAEWRTWRPSWPPTRPAP
jgi:NAD(P)-dependent dehydrogenase (short-subunit alcohol dehydrogenase family)